MDSEDVAALLEQHRSSVSSVSARLDAFLKTTADEEMTREAREYPLDEVGVLRFVLSAVSKKKDAGGSGAEDMAFDNITYMLQFRKEHKAWFHEVKSWTSVAKHSPFPQTVAGFCGNDVVIVNSNFTLEITERMRQQGITGVDDLFRATVMSNESVRRVLDARTRATGRLSKLLNIMNIERMSLSGLNLSVMRIFGQVSKLNDRVLPQFLRKVVMLNGGMVLNVAIKMMRPFVSAATMEKQAVCPAKLSSKWCKRDLSKCPFASQNPDLAKCVSHEYGGVLDDKNIL